MLKAAVIIDDSHGMKVFRALKESDEIMIITLVDLSGDQSWVTADERKNYYITTDLARICVQQDLQVAINVAANPGVHRLLEKNIDSAVELVQVRPDSFLMTLLYSKTGLQETRLLRGELLAILNSVQDPIEVVDSDGMIKYINPAFTRITGIPESDRVNRNIFEVSPHGALANSLIQQKPVVGYRTVVGGSNAEVVSNASPIIVDGEIRGAVVVFQLVNDILKLMDQLNYSHAVIENLYAQIDQISGTHWTLDNLAGQSKLFRASMEMARKAARSDVPVLLVGETGTGKEVFAQAVHNSSNRRGRPLIHLDCSALPVDIQEVELFGCEKGALSGVVNTRLGKVELARGGTLYLKGVTALNPFLQEKLVGLVQEKQFRRIGGDVPVQADVRLIASTNHNPKAALQKGIFNEALYHCLNMVEINLFPLRKRTDDLPQLVQEFVNLYNRKFGKHVQDVAPSAMQALREYNWPGNINELKNVIERAMAVCEGTVIEYSHLSPYIGMHSDSLMPINEVVPLDKMEQILLKLALARYGETLEGKKKAAQALNISLATLYNKLKKYRANM